MRKNLTILSLLFVFIFISLDAHPGTVISPCPKLGFVGTSGDKLYTYITGTTTPLASYDEDGNANTNPVILDSDGLADVWLDEESIYRFKLYNSSNEHQWTVDNIQGSGLFIPVVAQLSDYDDLADAVSTISSTATELWIDQDDTMDENITSIPTTLKFKFIEGNTITTTGYTLGFSGSAQNHIIALDGQRLFEGSGSVSFGSYGRIPVPWFATSGTGTSSDPWVDALRNAESSVGGYIHYHLPGGFYEDASKVTIDTDRITITGDGMGITNVNYDNADTNPCWEFVSSGVSLWYYRISGITFNGETTSTGGALSFSNVSDIVVENCNIKNFNGGTSAFGIKVAGRDHVVIRDNYINSCTIPILAMANPDSAIDIDHWTLQDNVLGPGDATNGYAIKLDDGVDYVNDLFVLGTNPVVTAKYGFYWSGGATTGSNVVIEGLGCESMSTSGWAIYFDPSNDQVSLDIRNCTTGGYNGIYVRKTESVVSTSNYIGASAGYTAYNVDLSTAGSFIIIGGYRDNSATMTVAEARLYKTYDDATYDFPGIEIYGGSGYFDFEAAYVPEGKEITYAATMSPDLSDGNVFTIEITDGNAFTIGNPTGIGGYEDWFLAIKNSSGGAHGVITWGSNYKFSTAAGAPATIANGNVCIIKFLRVFTKYIGTYVDDVPP